MNSGAGTREGGSRVRKEENNLTDWGQELTQSVIYLPAI